MIAFRDRGVDPLRKANLDRVLAWWEDFDAPVIVVDDGRQGKAHFNRSRAYNIGAKKTDADILIYVEADTLIPYDQIRAAADMAGSELGMVVPFTHQKKLGTTESMLVRAGLKEPYDCVPDPHPYGEMSNYGCANVLSRATLAAVGRWDEVLEGHGHDDNAMWQAFNKAARPTRWVDGPAYHLYHLDFDPDICPGAHITAEDKAAQERNYRRMQLYCFAQTAEEIRHLTSGGQSLATSWRSRWTRAS